MDSNSGTFKVVAMILVVLLLVVFFFIGGLVNSMFGIFAGNPMGGANPEPIDGLFGTKVAYRPSEYDFNANTGVDAENSNYVYRMATNILSSLANIYGLGSQSQTENGITLDNIKFNVNSQPNGLTDEEISKIKSAPIGQNVGEAQDSLYLYDSIRYQLKKDKVKTANNQTEAQYPMAYVADTNYSWIWSFEIKQSKDLDTYHNSLTYNAINDSLEAGTDLKSPNFYYQLESSFNRNNTYKNSFTDTTNMPQAYDELFVTPYLTAMRIIIYEAILGLNPSDFVVNYSQGEVSPSSGIYGPAVRRKNEFIYDYSDPNKKGDYEPEYLKILIEKFKREGSYVGLNAKTLDVITNYILTFIIGENARQLEEYKLYERVIPLIVQTCGKQIYTGTGDFGEGGGNVYDPFPAAQIKDYVDTSFFVSPDNDPFPLYKTQEEIDNNPNAILPRQYQSIVFMPTRDMHLMATNLLFKYDAGNDGDEIFEEGLTLDINIKVIWYNAKNNVKYEVCSDSISVPDGPAAPLLDSNYRLLGFYRPDNDEEFCPLIEPFDRNVGDDAINAIEAVGGTIEITGIRTKPYGKNPVDFYKLRDSDSGFGGIATLNSNLIDSSYIEIQLDVLKKPKYPDEGENNYNFYVQAGFIEAPSDYNYNDVGL